MNFNSQIPVVLDPPTIPVTPPGLTEKYDNPDTTIDSSFQEMHKFQPIGGKMIINIPFEVKHPGQPIFALRADPYHHTPTDVVHYLPPDKFAKNCNIYNALNGILAIKQEDAFNVYVPANKSAWPKPDSPDIASYSVEYRHETPLFCKMAMCYRGYKGSIDFAFKVNSGTITHAIGQVSVIRGVNKGNSSNLFSQFQSYDVLDTQTTIFDGASETYDPFNLATQQEIVVSVPYNYLANYRSRKHLENRVNRILQANGEEGFGNTNEWDDEGETWIVFSPLSNMATLSNARIEIVPFIRAGQDFQFVHQLPTPSYLFSPNQYHSIMPHFKDFPDYKTWNFPYFRMGNGQVVADNRGANWHMVKDGGDDDPPEQVDLQMQSLNICNE